VPEHDYLLRLKNIESYYGPIVALKGISLEISAGLMTTILGANGAGKSTILKTISGALCPSRGQVEFLGKPIQNLTPDKIHRLGMAHVPEGREIFPLLSTYENLKLGAYCRRHKKEILADLDFVTQLFPRLRARFYQQAGTLSGGEQQMLAIGRALMSRPKLLLLDEPSLGLSPLFVQEIFSIIKSIQKSWNLSIILVEQNAALALSLSDFGHILENGRIVMEGPSEILLENEDIKEFYLGHKDLGIKGRRRWKRKKTWRL